MSNLTLVKNELFEGNQADIYNSNDTFFMTSNQLSKCLGYTSKNGIEKLLERNPYLKDNEFSTTDVLSVVEGNRTVSRTLRIFNEDGIYEVAFLSKTEVARLFRSWVREVLKELRRQSQLPTETQSPVAILDYFYNAIKHHQEILSDTQYELHEAQHRITKLESDLEIYSINVNPLVAKRNRTLNYMLDNCDIYNYAENPKDEKAKAWKSAISALHHMFIADIRKVAKDYAYGVKTDIRSETCHMFIECYNGTYRKRLMAI